MRNECGTHNTRRFFRVLSRGKNIPVLRKALNDIPAASVPAFTNGFDGLGAKIAFPKIPVFFFHGGKDNEIRINGAITLNKQEYRELSLSKALNFLRR